MGVLCWSLFCGVVLGVFSSLEEVRVGCFTLCCGCLSVLSLILTAPWVGLHSVIVVFPGHTHFLLEK